MVLFALKTSFEVAFGQTEWKPPLRFFDDLNVMNQMMFDLELTPQQRAQIRQYRLELHQNVALLNRGQTKYGDPTINARVAHARKNGRQDILNVLTKARRQRVREKTLSERIRYGGLIRAIKSEDVAPKLGELNLTPSQWDEVQTAHRDVVSVTKDQLKNIQLRKEKMVAELNHEFQEKVVSEFTTSQ